MILMIFCIVLKEALTSEAGVNMSLTKPILYSNCEVLMLVGLPGNAISTS